MEFQFLEHQKSILNFTIQNVGCKFDFIIVIAVECVEKYKQYTASV